MDKTLNPAAVIRIALIDPDHRVLLIKAPDQPAWDFPGTALEVTDDALEEFVQALQDNLQINTTTQALFPLTFALTDAPATITLLYGCRNWTNDQLLQHVQADTYEMVWVRPVRMVDYALTPSCHMMTPSLMALLA